MAYLLGPSLLSLLLPSPTLTVDPLFDLPEPIEGARGPEPHRSTAADDRPGCLDLAGLNPILQSAQPDLNCLCRFCSWDLLFHGENIAYICLACQVLSSRVEMALKRRTGPGRCCARPIIERATDGAEDSALWAKKQAGVRQRREIGDYGLTNYFLGRTGVGTARERARRTRTRKLKEKVERRWKTWGVFCPGEGCGLLPEGRW